VLLFFCVFTVTIFTQSAEKITKERFNFLIDSLSNNKKSLVFEKVSLTNKINELEKRLTELDEEIKTCKTNKLIKKYGKEIGARIVNGQIWKGMTESMLEDCWGKPDKITKNKEKWGTFSQWYYGEITYFFKDKELIGWEEKKSE
jgi:tetrahydromethanopterin S-methyltransferase subunit G